MTLVTLVEMTRPERRAFIAALVADYAELLIDRRRVRTRREAHEEAQSEIESEVRTAVRAGEEYWVARSGSRF